MIINTFDSNFSHVDCLHPRRKSKLTYKFFESYDFSGISLFTDEHCFSPSVDKVNSKYKIALAVEPPEVKPYFYSNIKSVEHKFNYIFTYYPERFNSEKYKLFCWGACWIPEDYCKIYQKNKMISMVCSNKDMTSGHIFRKQTAEIVKNLGVDVWGWAYKNFSEEPEGRIAPYSSYRYVIVIENSIYPNYFTEKLIDAFAAGCIPIYRGDPNISKYFDVRGMYTFSTHDELKSILNNISENDYNSKLEYVKINFEKQKQYESPDNYLHNSLINLNL